MKRIGQILLILGIAFSAFPFLRAFFPERSLRGEGDSDSFYVVVHYPLWILMTGALIMTTGVFLILRSKSNPRG